MRFFGLSIFILLLIMSMFAVSMRTQGKELGEVIDTLKEIEEPLMNLTNTFEYTSPYKEDLSVKEIILNIANAFVYQMIIISLTLIMAVTIFVYKYMGNNIVFGFAKILLLWMVMWGIVNSVKPVGAFYVFYEDIFEKKKKKVNKFLILLLAIITWILLWIIGIGLIFFITEFIWILFIIIGLFIGYYFYRRFKKSRKT